MSVAQQAAEGLRRALARIEDPDRWCRWYPAVDVSGASTTWGWRESAVRWSVSGATECEIRDPAPLNFARNCVGAASRELFPHRNAAPEVDAVNDLEGHAAALVLLRRAIEIAETPALVADS